jgi:hypothetical protein
MVFNRGIITVRQSSSHNADSTTVPLLPAVLLAYNPEATPENAACICLLVLCVDYHHLPSWKHRYIRFNSTLIFLTVLDSWNSE